MSRGWTTERIARRRGISPTAGKNRLATARDRVGAATRSELVACRARDERPHRDAAEPATTHRADPDPDPRTPG